MAVPLEQDVAHPEERENGESSIGFYSRIELNTGLHTIVGAEETQKFLMAGISVGANIKHWFLLGASVSTNLVPTLAAFRHLYVGPLVHFYPTSSRQLGIGIEGGYLTLYELSGFYLSGVLGLDWPLGENSSHRLGIGAKVTFEKVIDPAGLLPALSPSIVVRYSYF